MKGNLEFSELEQVYDLLANAIDEAGEKNETLFLSKLCITLAQCMGDIEKVREAIDIAGKGILEVEPE